MKRSLIIIAVFVVVAIVGGLAIWWLFQNNKQTENGQDNDVPIQAQFDSKIVYTTDLSTETQPLIDHCENQGGEFNECGNICSPSAEACSTVCAYTCDFDGEDAVNTQTWQRYQNEDFYFTLLYPDTDWRVHESPTAEFDPKFNFYLSPETDSSLGNEENLPNLPLDHFANTTHVSVYPKGIATEGLLGQTVPLDIDLGIDVSQRSVLYVLEDGTPFAALVRPINSPVSVWGEAGFIYGRLRVNNLTTQCLRDGEEISQEECDPLKQEDEIIWDGSVDEEVWPAIIEILKSFSFLENTTDTSGLISVNSPAPNSVVSSPINISGQARGGWYFEGTFPVILTDWDGRIIAQVNAQAQREWMTDDFVPFTATIIFERPEFGDNGMLVFRRSNPSGLPENDATVEVPVFFE